MLSKAKLLRITAAALFLLGLCVTVLNFGGRQKGSFPCGDKPCSGGPIEDGAASALKNYYTDQGYFWAVVQEDGSQKGKVHYTVLPGDIYHFDKAVIVGAPDAWAAEFLASLALRRGDVYRPVAVNTWLAPLKERGPLQPGFPEYQPRRITINTDRDSHTVSLVLEVALGP